MKIKNNIGLEGLFRLQTFKKDSPEIIQDSGWFSNMILDSGLNQMTGSFSYLNYACVGTGTNPVTAAQTTLQTFLVSSAYGTGVANGITGSNPYYCFQRVRYQFDVGTAAGNLTEVGIKESTSASGTLFSRALIKDNLGNPTTFTVLGDEILQIIYELRCYPNQTDVVINNVESSAGVTHTVTIRPANNTTMFAQYYAYPFISSFYTIDIRTGTITAITTSPSGDISGGSYNTLVTIPYVQNSFKREFSATWSVNNGNSNNINSCILGGYMGLFQVGFSPPLVKTSSDILRLDFELSWGRRE